MILHLGQVVPKDQQAVLRCFTKQGCILSNSVESKTPIDSQRAVNDAELRGAP